MILPVSEGQDSPVSLGGQGRCAGGGGGGESESQSRGAGGGDQARWRETGKVDGGEAGPNGETDGKTRREGRVS
jgi:hypothetical protein